MDFPNIPRILRVFKVFCRHFRNTDDLTFTLEMHIFAKPEHALEACPESIDNSVIIQHGCNQRISNQTGIRQIFEPLV